MYLQLRDDHKGGQGRAGREGGREHMPLVDLVQEWDSVGIVRMYHGSGVIEVSKAEGLFERVLCWAFPVAP